MNKLKQLYSNPVGKDYLVLSGISVGFAILSLISTLMFLAAHKDAYAAFTISVTAVNAFNSFFNYREYKEWKKTNK